MIKMIALDLDATLLDSDKQISSFDIEVLKRLHNQGMKVVVCTGRPLSAIQQYLDQLGLTRPADFTITFNGALVVNNHTGEHLFEKGLAKFQLGSVYQFAKQNAYPLNILDFSSIYELPELVPSRYHQVLRATTPFVVRPFEQLDPNSIYSKAIMSADPRVLDTARNQFTNDDQYHIVRSQPEILEFLPAQMSKAVGLMALLNHFHYQFSELMAFGDAENDLEMISAAGIGVAMQNAQPEVKAVADKITKDDNDHHGVGRFLQHYFEHI